MIQYKPITKKNWKHVKTNYVKDESNNAKFFKSKKKINTLNQNLRKRINDQKNETERLTNKKKLNKKGPKSKYLKDGR